jgi:enoyl-CoA hydratase/carnithine racemase
VNTIGLEELVDRLAFGGGLSELSSAGVPVAPLHVVQLDGLVEADWRRLAAAPASQALALPGPILIGLSSEPLPRAAAPIIELLACTLAPEGPGRAWVSLDGVTELERLGEMVAQAPLAATTLVQLLRVTPILPVPDALVAESFAYSMLLAGPEHAAWRGRTPVREVVADDRPVYVERRGDVLLIELDRPRRHNAFGHALRDALLEALELADADASIRRVALSGRGSSFCSGGDLDEFGSLPGPAQAHAIRMATSVGGAVHRLRDRVEVRVHGAVVGAGVEVASFAGHVAAEESAWFCMPELSLGLVPGAGGTVSVPRRIGRWRTAWMALTGSRVDLATALAWGLVDARADSTAGFLPLT